MGIEIIFYHKSWCGCGCEYVFVVSVQLMLSLRTNWSLFLILILRIASNLIHLLHTQYAVAWWIYDKIKYHRHRYQLVRAYDEQWKKQTKKHTHTKLLYVSQNSDQINVDWNCWPFSFFFDQIHYDDRFSIEIDYAPGHLLCPMSTT